MFFIFIAIDLQGNAIYAKKNEGKMGLHIIFIKGQLA